MRERSARACRWQSLPAWLQVRSLVVAEAAALATAPRRSFALEAALDPTGERAQKRRARRGSFMLAVGAGLLAAGVATAAVYGRSRVCDRHEAHAAAPIAIGTIAAFSGLALITAGALRLRRTSARDLTRPVADGLGIPLTVIGTGLLGFGVSSALSWPALFACSLS